MSVLSIRASQKFLCSMHLKPKSNEKMYCLEVHALYSIINGRCDRQNTWLASGAVEKKAERRSHAFVGVTDGRNNLPVFWLTATKAAHAAFFMPLSVLQLWFGLQKLLVSQEKTVSTRSTDANGCLGAPMDVILCCKWLFVSCFSCHRLKFIAKQAAGVKVLHHFVLSKGSLAPRLEISAVWDTSVWFRISRLMHVSRSHFCFPPWQFLSCFFAKEDCVFIS